MAGITKITLTFQCTYCKTYIDNVEVTSKVFWIDPNTTYKLSVSGSSLTCSYTLEGASKTFEVYASKSNADTAQYTYSTPAWASGTAGTYTDTSKNLIVTSTRTTKKYYVTVRSAGNGTVSGGNNTYSYGTSITISATAADNYFFSHWSDNGAKSHSITVTGADTFTAYFSTYSYKITYNANGGTGTAPDPTTLTPTKVTSASLQLKANTFTRTNYKFVGWSVNNTVYGETDYVVLSSTNQQVIAYAVWERVSASVTFSDYDGSEYTSGSTTFTIRVGQSMEESQKTLPTAARSNAIFDHFVSEDSRLQQRPFDKNTIIEDDLVVTPRFKYIYTIKYNVNGGWSGPEDTVEQSTDLSHNTTIAMEMPIPPTSEKFGGWSTDKDTKINEYTTLYCGGDTYTLTNKNQTVTLYAIYAAPHTFYFYNDKTKTTSSYTKWDGETLTIPQAASQSVQNAAELRFSNTLVPYPKLYSTATYTNNKWNCTSEDIGRYLNIGDVWHVYNSNSSIIRFTSLWTRSFSDIQIPSNYIPSEQAYMRFSHWNTGSAGEGTKYRPGSVFPGYKFNYLSDDSLYVVLYAQYVDMKYVYIRSNNTTWGTTNPSGKVQLPSNFTTTVSPYNRQILTISGGDEYVKPDVDVVTAIPIENQGTFLSWEGGRDSGYIQANFSAYQYHVLFIPNNLSGSSVIKWYNYDSTYYIPNYGSLGWTMTERETFRGYNTRADGKGTMYGERTACIKQDLTLYGITQKETYTVYFNADGGTIDTNSKTVIANGKFGELPVPQKEGKVFVCWQYRDMGTWIDKVDENTDVNTIIPEGTGSITLRARYGDYYTMHVSAGDLPSYNVYFTPESYAGNNKYWYDTTFKSRRWALTMPKLEGSKVFLSYIDTTTRETVTDSDLIIKTNEYTPPISNRNWVPTWYTGVEISLSVNNKDMGSATISWTDSSGVPHSYHAPCTAKIEEGLSYTLTATPATGYSFRYFQQIGTNITYKKRSVTGIAKQNANYRATFSSFTLTVKSEDATTGTVSTEQSVSGSSLGTKSFLSGESLTVFAYPSNGYEFMEWCDENGSHVSSDSAYTTPPLTKDTILIAKFRFVIEIKVQPYGLSDTGTGVTMSLIEIQPGDAGVTIPGKPETKRYYKKNDRIHIHSKEEAKKGANTYTRKQWTLSSAQTSSLTPGPDRTLYAGGTLIFAYEGESTVSFTVCAVSDEPNVDMSLVSTYGSGEYDKNSFVGFGVNFPKGYSVAGWSTTQLDTDSLKEITHTVSELGTATASYIHVYKDMVLTAYIIKNSIDPILGSVSLETLQNNPYYSYRYNTRGVTGYNPCGPGINPLENNASYSCYGNCTWHAWGRVAEMIGRDVSDLCKNVPNAGDWYGAADVFRGWKREGGTYGMTISSYEPGDILCYGNHVEVVEKVFDDYLWVSYSGNLPVYKDSPVQSGKRYYLKVGECIPGETKNNFQGVIHNPLVGNNSSSEKYVSVYGYTVPKDVGYVHINSHITSLSSAQRLRVGEFATLDYYLKPAYKSLNFNGWSDGSKIKTRTDYRIKNTEPVVVAYFGDYKPNEVYLLVTDIYPSHEAGTITMDHEDGLYAPGETATLTATPKEGYNFLMWSSGEVTRTLTVNVDSNMVVTAMFYSLSSGGTSAFRERTAIPKQGNPAYTTKLADGDGTVYGGASTWWRYTGDTSTLSEDQKWPGCTLPNCGALAWGRWYEMTGYDMHVNAAAINIWNYEKSKGKVVASDTPTLGACAFWDYLYRGTQNHGGHMAIIERINGPDSFTWSESNYYRIAEPQTYWCWHTTNLETLKKWCNGSGDDPKFLGFLTLPGGSAPWQIDENGESTASNGGAYDCYNAHKGDLTGLTSITTDIMAYTKETDLSENGFFTPALKLIVTYYDKTTGAQDTHEESCAQRGQGAYSGWLSSWTLPENKVVSNIEIKLNGTYPSNNSLSINSIIIQGYGYTTELESENSVKITRYFNGTEWITM